MSYLQQKHPSKLIGNMWMISFADLLSLLITFFILMYSTSNLSIKNAEDDNSAKQVKSFVHKETSTNPNDVNINYLSKIIEGALTPTLYAKEIVIKLLHNTLIIVIPTDILFSDNISIDSFEELLCMEELGFKTSELKCKGYNLFKLLEPYFVSLKNLVEVKIAKIPGAQLQPQLAHGMLIAKSLGKIGYQSPVDVYVAEQSMIMQNTKLPQSSFVNIIIYNYSKN